MRGNYFHSNITTKQRKKITKIISYKYKAYPKKLYSRLNRFKLLTVDPKKYLQSVLTVHLVFYNIELCIEVLFCFIAVIKPRLEKNCPNFFFQKIFFYYRLQVDSILNRTVHLFLHSSGIKSSRFVVFLLSVLHLQEKSDHRQSKFQLRLGSCKPNI